MCETPASRRGFSGFGLLGLLIVLAIILFMYFGGSKSYVQNVVDAKKKGDSFSIEIQAQQLAVLIASHRMNHNDAIPNTYEDLDVDPASFLDPWKNTMRFRVERASPGTAPKVILISNGPDGTPDTDDDITATSMLPM